MTIVNEKVEHIKFGSGVIEEALEITEALVKSNAVDVIVVDSVAALVPKAEIEGDMGDSHIGLQALAEDEVKDGSLVVKIKKEYYNYSTEGYL